MPGPQNLTWAAEEGEVAMARRLLAEGADPDERLHPGGVTPSMLAVDRPGDDAYQRQDDEVARLLLNAGADVNATTDDGWTALHFAVRAGARATRLLLDHGANPNSKTARGITPLHWCSEYAAADAAEILLEAQADTSAHDAQARTALDMAENELRAFPSRDSERLVALLRIATPNR
jgi:ankyrin repeat protein